MTINIPNLNWEKMDGLIPVVIQNIRNGQVLMQAFMNQEALQKTLATNKVCFFSRSKNRLWTKGETSGNYLELVQMVEDCDQDALLLQVNPTGPVCHTGTASCFNFDKEWNSLSALENIIESRSKCAPEESYTAELLHQGLSRIAQKVGEEGVEVALAAVEKNNEKLSEETADLIFHVLLLLKSRGLRFSDVLKVLKNREK